MHARSAVKVGLAVVLSIGTFIAVWFFLMGRGLRSRTYPLSVEFRDAQSITSGADVRMAGVLIGTVHDIELTNNNRARLNLLIDRQYQIPRGAQFIITAGGLIGEKYVSINPPAIARAYLPPGSSVRGQETIQIEDLMAKASQLAGSSDKVIREAQGALADTRVAIRSVTRLVQDPTLQRSLHATLANVESASRHADVTAEQFQAVATRAQGFAVRSEPQVSRTLAAVEKSADNVQQLTGALSGILAGTDVKTDLGATLHNMRLATDRLNAIANNLDRLTGDPQMAADLKETVANIKATSAASRATAETVNESVERLTARLRRRGSGMGTGTPGSAARSTQLATHATVDLLETTDPARFRADVNAVVPTGSGSFVYGGLRGLGDNNRLNLQMGQLIENGWDARYGIYNGRLGAGLDYGLGGLNGWSADAYDPNHLTVDLYGRRRVSDDTSVTFGLENLPHHVMPTVGVRIRR